MTPRLGLALVLVALLACGRKSTTSNPAPSVGATVEAAPVVAPIGSTEPETEQDPVRLASAATFKKDRLLACMDIAVVSPWLESRVHKMDSGLQEALEDEARVLVAGGKSWIGKLIDAKHGKGKALALGVGGDPQPSSEPCQGQFAGRTVLASCTVQIVHRGDAGPPDRVGIQIHHYDAMLSDKALRACMAVRGKWDELPKDSLQFRNQKHHQMFDEALRALE